MTNDETDNGAIGVAVICSSMAHTHLAKTDNDNAKGV